jgi:hypothetical protein
MLWIYEIGVPKTSLNIGIVNQGACTRVSRLMRYVPNKAEKKLGMSGRLPP